MEWTVIIAMFLLADSLYNNCYGLDINYSDVAVGWTVSSATFVALTVIIAMLLCVGLSVQQLLWAGQSL